MPLDRTTPPPFRQTENIILKSPQEFRLPNGIPLFWFANPDLDLIHLSIKIKAGALYEPQKRIAGFCYNLLKESHPEKSAEEFEAFLDYYGTALNISAGINQISINVQFPKRNGGFVIPELARMLIAPQYRSENFTRYRAKTIKDWEYNARKVDYRTTQLMFHLFFHPKYPFGKLPERFDFENITLEKIQEYHRDTCRAENIRLFLAGNASQDLLNLVSEHFSLIKNGEKMPVLSDISGEYHPQHIHEKWDDALQTSFVLCHHGPAYNATDIHTFRFFNTLFCNYFGSRLMQNLRESNGYTYGINGSLFHYEGGSIHYIESDVNNDKAEAAIQACFDEMKRLREEPVNDEEMEIVRNYLFGNVLQSIDGTVQYMQSYIGWHDFGCREERFYNYFNTIKNITAEDVMLMANKYLRKEDFSVLSVGN